MMSSVEVDLYTFHKVSHFPYAVGHNTSRLSHTGRVLFTDMYWVKPLILLPPDDGLVLQNKLNKLNDEFNKAQDALLEEYRGKLGKIFPEALE